MAKSRVFILSPANSGGRRAGYLTNPQGSGVLAKRLQAGEAVPLGELFTYMSQLYFRGKLAYAKRFARPPQNTPGVLVITPNQGLVEAERPFNLEELQSLSQTRIDGSNDEYRQPLINSGLRLANAIGTNCDVVLLGSIASDKYVKVLLECFGPQLLFPADFVGRGDMSRGGLLLRCAEENRELEYIPVSGAVRRGVRPPKLPAIQRRATSAKAGDEE